MRFSKSILGVLLLASIFVVSPAAAEEKASWPQWGGPARDGAVADGFGEGELRFSELWRRPAPQGISALVVADDRLFSLGSEDREDHVFALGASSGEELWRISLGERTFDLDFGPPNTPATDGRSVFVVSPSCRLLALEAKSGEISWQKDLQADYEMGEMRRGCWTSPLLDGNRLIVQLNGGPGRGRGIVAFAKSSGKELWHHAAGTRGFLSSPAVAEMAGVRQVLVHDVAAGGKGGFYGLRIDDGKRVWDFHFDAAESYSGDSPIPVAGDRVAVVTWNDFRLVQVDASGESPTAASPWASRSIRAIVQPLNFHAVFHQEHFYGFGGDFLVCIDATTGKTLWEEKIYSGSVAVAGSDLVTLSQAAGMVRIVTATPEGYSERAALEVFNPGAPTDTPPSVAGRRIFLRNSEEMVALEVRKQ